MEKTEIYDFLGGGQVRGATPFDLAEAMRRQSHTPTDNLQEFMEQTAGRCKVQRGSEIRTDNVDNFISDLLAEEYLKKV